MCDPEAEYYPLVQKLGGQVIRISPISTDYINPLDINSLKSYSPVGTPRKIPLRNTTDKSQWFLGVGHEKRRSKASFSDDMEVT